MDFTRAEIVQLSVMPMVNVGDRVNVTDVLTEDISSDDFAWIMSNAFLILTMQVGTGQSACQSGSCLPEYFCRYLLCSRKYSGKQEPSK